MAKVLIVEDLEAKCRAIQRLIRREHGITPEWARSVSAAYALVDESWDLILLDMNFQVSDDVLNKDAGKAAIAGIELLQFMSAQNIKVPVVVITAQESFSESAEMKIGSIDDLDQRLRENFDVYRGAVKVEYTTDEWHDNLLALVNPLLAKNAS